jgi:hypothetical protein
MSKRARVFWTGFAVAVYCAVMALVVRTSGSTRLGLAVIATQLLAAAMLYVWLTENQLPLR